MLAAGADPNAPERSDRATPPIMAFEFARYDLPSILPKILETLMAFGADINSRDGHGETLLLRLLKPRDVSEIDHEDDLKWPASFLPSCVRIVLRAGANPNLGDRTGATPLHYAVALSNPELVQLLLQAGAMLLPPNPYFYAGAKTIEELADTVVARVLDHLGVENTVSPRWPEEQD